MIGKIFSHILESDMSDIYDKILGTEKKIKIKRENLNDLTNLINYSFEMDEGTKIEDCESVNIIDIPNLLSVEGVHSALDRLVEMTQDRKWKNVKREKSGMTIFLFKTGNNYYNEYNFFYTAIQVEKTEDKIAKIVKNYINYEYVSYIHFSDSSSPLAPAAGALSTFDERYLDLTREFMGVLDWEHSFYERDEYLEAIYTKWGNSNECVRFQIGLYFAGGIDFEGYGFLDRMDVGEALYEWIQENQNRQFAIYETVNFLKKGEESGQDYGVGFMQNLEWAAESKGGEFEKFAKELKEIYIPPSYITEKKYDDANQYKDEADVLSGQGKHSAATELYLKVVELIPERLVAHISLGNNLRVLKKFREAYTVLQNAVHLFPESYGEAHISFGLVLTDLVEHKKAQELFLKAIELAPESPYAHYHLGCSYSNVGAHRQALVQFKEALEKGENLKRLYFPLGFSLLGLGEYDQSIAWFVKEIKENGSKKTNAYFYMARAFGIKGEDKRSSGALDKALAQGWEVTKQDIEDDIAFKEIEKSLHFTFVMDKFFS